MLVNKNVVVRELARYLYSVAPPVWGSGNPSTGRITAGQQTTRIRNAGRLKQTEPELGRRRYTTYREAVVTGVAVVGRVDAGKVEVQEAPAGATAGAAIPVVTAVASVEQVMIAGADVTTTNKIQRSSIKFPVGVLAGTATDAIFGKQSRIFAGAIVWQAPTTRTDGVGGTT